jgi:hypothetical protein
MRAFTSHQVGEPTATHVPADANRTNERRRVYACRLRSCPCPAPHQIQRRASIYSLAIVVCATPYVQAMSDRARVIRACLACFHCRQIAIAFLHIRAFPERPRRKHNSSCISHYYLLDRQRTSPLSKVTSIIEWANAFRTCLITFRLLFVAAPINPSDAAVSMRVANVRYLALLVQK